MRNKVTYLEGCDALMAEEPTPPVQQKGQLTCFEVGIMFSFFVWAWVVVRIAIHFAPIVGWIPTIAIGILLIVAAYLAMPYIMVSFIWLMLAPHLHNPRCIVCRKNRYEDLEKPDEPDGLDKQKNLDEVRCKVCGKHYFISRNRNKIYCLGENDELSLCYIRKALFWLI
jgi:hypothetical protein